MTANETKNKIFALRPVGSFLVNLHDTVHHHDSERNKNQRRAFLTEEVSRRWEQFPTVRTNDYVEYVLNLVSSQLRSTLRTVNKFRESSEEHVLAIINRHDYILIFWELECVRKFEKDNY